MSRRPTLVWATLAVIGLLIAVGVSYAASRLASPDVGLSSEPITAGSKLAPPRSDADSKERANRTKRGKKPGKTTTTPSAPPVRTQPATPPPVTPPPTDDNSGSDDSGSHGGGDDSTGHGSGDDQDD